MDALQSFTAIALATTQPPPDRYGSKPLVVTGVGFLATYVHKGAIGFDLATRAIPDERSEVRLVQWVQANVPGGLRAGLHLDRYDDFDLLPTASIFSLHRPTRLKSRTAYVELETWCGEWPMTSAKPAHRSACRTPSGSRRRPAGSQPRRR